MNKKYLIASVLITTVIAAGSVYYFDRVTDGQVETEPYELLIKKAQTGVGVGAYQGGDIVAIMPAGYNWSWAERTNFIIVKANLTDEQKEELVKPKEWDTGEVDDLGEPIMELQARRKYNLDIKTIYDNKEITTEDIITK